MSESLASRGATVPPCARAWQLPGARRPPELVREALWLVSPLLFPPSPPAVRLAACHEGQARVLLQSHPSAHGHLSPLPPGLATAA